MKKTNRSAFIISILIPLVVGSLSALISGNMQIYSTLNKPAYSPPATLFLIVWTILYILMGIASFLIYTAYHPKVTKALRLYTLQLIMNFCWSIIFFRQEWYLAAFIWLLLMIIVILVMTYYFCQIRPVAAWLQVPYIAWCLYAAVLNFGVYKMN